MIYEQALENLYQVFSKYPLKDIQCCTCGCDRTKNKKVLMRTPLRQIDENAISYYAFKATYTMGDLKDFKHFLPQIFKFLHEVETEFVLRKLDENNFEHWDIDEINAIKEYLKYWIVKTIKDKYVDTDIIIQLANKIDLKTILYKWLKFEEKTAIINLISFIEENYNDVFTKNRFGSLKNNEYELISILKSWFNYEELKNRLEAIYFDVAEKNKDLGNDIEQAFYIISH